ncbi:hypothetical protein [Azospirillum palustre]
MRHGRSPQKNGWANAEESRPTAPQKTLGQKPPNGGPRSGLF